MVASLDVATSSSPLPTPPTVQVNTCDRLRDTSTTSTFADVGIRRHGTSLEPQPLRTLRDFLKEDDRLKQVVDLFAQKFMSVNGHTNFTLTTLSDMAWTILVVTREAILDGKLPIEDGPRLKESKMQYMELQDQFNEARLTYLQEISAYRDLKREKIWTAEMQQAFDELMEHDVFRFVPENSLDKQTKKYFAMTMEESLKMAMTRGASAGAEALTNALLRVKELEQEREELLEKIKHLEFELEQHPERAGSKSSTGDQFAEERKKHATKQLAEKQRMQADIERMEALIAELQAKLLAFENEKSQSFASNIETKKRLDELESFCEGQKLRIEELERELAASKAEARKHLLTIESLEAALAAAKKDSGSFRG